MDAFHINGGKPLRGTVRINGSKNASLPLMAASLLTTDPVTLHGVPNLSDIRAMQELLASLGMAFSSSTPAPAPPQAPQPVPAPAGKIDPKYSGLTELIKPKPTAPHAAAERSEAPGTPPAPPAPAASSSPPRTPRRPWPTTTSSARCARASACSGPMLAKRGKVAKVSMPGGCAIGDRPVDLHVRGL